MTPQLDPRIVRKLGQFVSFSSLFSIAVGLVGLAGWIFQIEIPENSCARLRGDQRARAFPKRSCTPIRDLDLLGPHSRLTTFPKERRATHARAGNGRTTVSLP